jgi:hypothetical protein
MTPVVAHWNIAAFNLFGSKYNSNTKAKLKIRNAQSMLQVMFKDMSLYLHENLDLKWV